MTQVFERHSGPKRQNDLWFPINANRPIIKIVIIIYQVNQQSWFTINFAYLPLNILVRLEMVSMGSNQNKKHLDLYPSIVTAETYKKN